MSPAERLVVGAVTKKVVPFMLTPRGFFTPTGTPAGCVSKADAIGGTAPRATIDTCVDLGRIRSCFPLLPANAGSCRYLPEIFATMLLQKGSFPRIGPTVC
jgi:hypothetical protein